MRLAGDLLWETLVHNDRNYPGTLKLKRKNGFTFKSPSEERPEPEQNQLTLQGQTTKPGCNYLLTGIIVVEELLA